MRRILSVFVVVALMLSASACGAIAEPEPTPIQLTTSNIHNYLEIDLGYLNHEQSTLMGLRHDEADITLSTYAVADGTFENVEISITIKLTQGWNCNSSDMAYDKDCPNNIVCEFRMPVTGSYTETHKVSALNTWLNLDYTSYVINSVSGTFIPAA